MPMDIVIDGQFGSTGKGKLADYLIRKFHYDMSACDFAPNAGHTVVDGDNKYVLRQLPVGVLVPDMPVHVGPGAAINPEIFIGEIDEHLCAESVSVHPNAVMVQDKHKELEARVTRRIASTMKGSGAALADKVMRTAVLARDTECMKQYISPQEFMMEQLNRCTRVLAETAQGLGLSLDGQFYPNCTGRNINIPAVLDRMGGVHPMYLGKVFMSVRTFPIRVGNIIEGGNMVGYSGDVWRDSREIQFEDIGMPKETTTVTGRVRRLFTWSDLMWVHSLLKLRPDGVFINFVNYINCEDYGCDDWYGLSSLTRLWVQEKLARAAQIGHRFEYVFLGTGPDRKHIIDVPLNNVYA